MRVNRSWYEGRGRVREAWGPRSGGRPVVFGPGADLRGRPSGGRSRACVPGRSVRAKDGHGAFLEHGVSHGAGEVVARGRLPTGAHHQQAGLKVADLVQDQNIYSVTHSSM
jgi:hypothetical protein